MPLPPHTSRFTLQVRSDSEADVSELDDILALAAAVHMFIQVNPPPPQQRYFRTLPELLTAVVELLTRHQPDDAPSLHTARTIQQVTRTEFHFPEILGV